MMPLSALISVLITVALPPPNASRVTPFILRTVNFSPASVLTPEPLGKLNAFLADTRIGTTWYIRILARVALFSGLSNIARVPAGSLANAALVGAKTVMFLVVISGLANPAAL